MSFFEFLGVYGAFFLSIRNANQAKNQKQSFFAQKPQK